MVSCSKTHLRNSRPTPFLHAPSPLTPPLPALCPVTSDWIISSNSPVAVVFPVCVCVCAPLRSGRQWRQWTGSLWRRRWKPGDAASRRTRCAAEARTCGGSSAWSEDTDKPFTTVHTTACIHSYLSRPTRSSQYTCSHLFRPVCAISFPSKPLHPCCTSFHISSHPSVPLSTPLFTPVIPWSHLLPLHLCHTSSCLLQPIHLPVSSPCLHLFIPVDSCTYLFAPVPTCLNLFIPVYTSSYLSISGIKPVHAHI